ncbi:hypothetical protein CCS92_34290, partial [Methylobacterium radiotolerans]
MRRGLGAAGALSAPSLPAAAALLGRHPPGRDGPRGSGAGRGLDGGAVRAREPGRRSRVRAE